MADLAISTATDVLSIAIATEGAIACETLHITRRHAEEITPALRRLSDSFEFELDAIENLYIDIGPGRFTCLLYTSPSPRDQRGSRMPSSA